MMNGHDFRPDYIECFEYFKRLKWWADCRKLATTATCNERVANELKKLLGDDVAVFRGTLVRENLEIRHVGGILNDAGHRKTWLQNYLVDVRRLSYLFVHPILMSKQVRRCFAPFLTHSYLTTS